jgi:hypothetical protein
LSGGYFLHNPCWQYCQGGCYYSITISVVESGGTKNPSRHYPHAKEGTDILTIPNFYPQSYPQTQFFLST